MRYLTYGFMLALLVCAASGTPARAQEPAAPDTVPADTTAPDPAAGERAPRLMVDVGPVVTVALGVGRPAELQRVPVRARLLDEQGQEVGTAELTRVIESGTGPTVAVTAAWRLTRVLELRVEGAIGWNELGVELAGAGETADSIRARADAVRGLDAITRSVTAAGAFHVPTLRQLRPYVLLGTALTVVEIERSGGAPGLGDATRGGGQARWTAALGVGAVLPFAPHWALRIEAVQQVGRGILPGAPAGQALSGEGVEGTFVEPAPDPFTDDREDLLSVRSYRIGLQWLPRPLTDGS